MKTYEVTIGIPVYNVEKYIRQTMDSALSQTFESIEFLICDDCGTDTSISIVEEYQKTHPNYTLTGNSDAATQQNKTATYTEETVVEVVAVENSYIYSIEVTFPTV